jgi:hypothetical protein
VVYAKDDLDAHRVGGEDGAKVASKQYGKRPGPSRGDCSQ